jgi:hypothetical protein
VQSSALHGAVSSTTVVGTTTDLSLGAQSNLSAAVNVAPPLAGTKFTVRTHLRVNSATSTGGDSSSARFGMAVLCDSADVLAGTGYGLRYVPLGNQAGRLTLSRLGTGSGTLTGTLSSANKIAFTPGLEGELNFTATYSGGSLTIEGSFASGGATITVSGTDTAPLAGTWFGLTAQAAPFNVNATGPGKQYSVTADADFLDFALNPGDVTAGNDQFFIRGNAPAVLKVLANDTAPAGLKLRIKSVEASPVAQVSMTGAALTYTPKPSFAGIDSFHYVAAAGAFEAAPALVTVSNPFIAVKGSYFQIIRQGAEAVGSVDVKITAGGAITGKVVLLGRSYVLQGLCEFNLTYAQKLRRPGVPEAGLALTFDASGSAPTVSGSLAQDSANYSIAASPVGVTVLPGSLPAGDYTVRLGRDDSDQGAPRGHGFARLVVSPAGTLTFTGRLGDDAALSSKSRLLVDSTANFFTALYVKPVGSLSGSLTLPQSGVYAMRGTLAWRKPQPESGALPYAGGFSETIELYGCRYLDPVRGANALTYPQPAAPRASVVLGEGGAAQTLGASVTAADVVRFDSPNTLKATFVITRGTGLFSGTFRPAGARLPTHFRGALLQAENGGFGVYRDGAVSQPITFTPP